MKEAAPFERHETIRQQLKALLGEKMWPASALSKVVRLSEKEVYGHLESMKRIGLLAVTPAACGDCGYTFTEREKTKKPSKCPKCKGTYINPPLFALRSK